MASFHTPPALQAVPALSLHQDFSSSSCLRFVPDRRVKPLLYSIKTSIFPSFLSSSSFTSPFSSSFVTKASSKENGSQDNVPDAAVESVQRLLASKSEAELRERILSGEFSVSPSKSNMRKVREVLMTWGQLGRSLAYFLANLERSYLLRQAREMPEARGKIKAITGQPFFIPLYDLYLTYGGIFRLTFGPKSFVIISDPAIAKRLLKDNSKAYSKGILAEILDFVMGKGLIPAEEGVWRVRRRVIVPALHRKYVSEMVGLFGRAAQNLCQKLDAAASNGEDVEMESLFSRLTLDIIGKAVFNYDFNSLSLDTGIVEAVYTVLREAEDRSMAIIPYWDFPLIKDLSPRQKRVAAALRLINRTLDDLIGICKDERKFRYGNKEVERSPCSADFFPSQVAASLSMSQ